MDELLHAKKVTLKIMFNFDFMLTLDYLDNEIHIPWSIANEMTIKWETTVYNI